MAKFIVSPLYIGDRYKAGQVIELESLPAHLKYVLTPIPEDDRELVVNPEEKKKKTNK
jgi:predicted urease superfamily metal-dependent hydrolase